jgi:hypothetical protein
MPEWVCLLFQFLIPKWGNGSVPAFLRHMQVGGSPLPSRAPWSLACPAWLNALSMLMRFKHPDTNSFVVSQEFGPIGGLVVNWCVSTRWLIML